MAEQQEKIK